MPDEFFGGMRDELIEDSTSELGTEVRASADYQEVPYPAEFRSGNCQSFDRGDLRHGLKARRKWQPPSLAIQLSAYFPVS